MAIIKRCTQERVRALENNIKIGDLVIVNKGDKHIEKGAIGKVIRVVDFTVLIKPEKGQENKFKGGDSWFAHTLDVSILTNLWQEVYDLTFKDGENSKEKIREIAKREIEKGLR